MTDLSEASLAEAARQIRAFTDDCGRKIGLNPTKMFTFGLTPRQHAAALRLVRDMPKLSTKAAISRRNRILRRP